MVQECCLCGGRGVRVVGGDSRVWCEDKDCSKGLETLTAVVAMRHDSARRWTRHGLWKLSRKTTPRLPAFSAWHRESRIEIAGIDSTTCRNSVHFTKFRTETAELIIRITYYDRRRPLRWRPAPPFRFVRRPRELASLDSAVQLPYLSPRGQSVS